MCPRRNLPVPPVVAAALYEGAKHEELDDLDLEWIRDHAWLNDCNDPVLQDYNLVPYVTFTEEEMAENAELIWWNDFKERGTTPPPRKSWILRLDSPLTI